MLAAAHGTAVRYLALLEGVDFFAPLPMINSIAEDNRIVMNLRSAPLGMRGQAAMVIDPLSWTAIGDCSSDKKFTAKFISETRDMLMRTGRSVAFILADDWEKNSTLWDYAVVPLPGLLSQERLAAFEKEFGKLPEVKKSDETLILLRNGTSLISSDMNLTWRTLALPEAQKAGFDTIWYVGENFTSVWNGNDLTIDYRKE